MLVQVQSAIRSAWPARCANDQAQHAVTPVAEQVLVSFGQQVVDGVNPFRIDLAQWCFGEITAGIEEGDGFAASVFGRGCPAEMFFVVAVQRGTTAGVARIEQEVLHIDRDELLGAARLVDVRAARDLPVVLFALATTADVLRPAGEVEQARIIAKGIAAAGLAAALVGDADQP
ncbi:hypothetical protein D3C84_570070 [compost metagenome]